MRTWSTNQDVIALSSGEAEYYGLVKTAAKAIGLKNLLADMGVEVRVELCTDASAALGIVHRRGVGRVRRLEVQQLWLQDRVAKGLLDVRKVRADKNFADVFTKAVVHIHMQWALQSLSLALCQGRHALSPLPDACTATCVATPP